MIAFANVAAAARAEGLAVVGAFRPGREDGAPEGVRSLLLLGPGGPEMWETFAASPEATDGAPDPLDRWSERVIDGLARRFGARAFYPFGGSPGWPFQRWGMAGEGARPSPMAMLVSAGRGLWVSYRGALGFAEALDLPEAQTKNPCAPCPAPCRNACPVDAFAGGRYDTARCAAHVRSDAGRACRDGCLVRSACPAGHGLDLPIEQRAFHVKAFLNARP